MQTDVVMYPVFGGPLVSVGGAMIGERLGAGAWRERSALPVATIRRVADTLAHGRIKRGTGVNAQPVRLPESVAEGAAQKPGCCWSRSSRVALRIGGLLLGD